MNVAYFPTINACLNGLAGVLLFLGWRAIKANQRERNRSLMIAGVILIVVFILSSVGAIRRLKNPRAEN